MRKLAILLGLSLLTLMAACGGGGEETSDPVADESAPEIAITNGLGEWDIYSVFIDPSDEPWTEERLAIDEILAPGETFTLEVTEGTYDIMVTDEDLDTYSLWQVDVGADGYEWTVTLDDMDSGWDEDYIEPIMIETGEGDAPIVITNDLSGWVIYYVYVDPTDEPWGEDRLGMEILDQGDVLTVWVDPGTYNMQVEDEDGDTYTLWGVEVGPEGYMWTVNLDYLD